MFVPKGKPLHFGGIQKVPLSQVTPRMPSRGFATQSQKYNHCIVPLNLNAHSENEGFLKEACKHTLQRLFITLHISPIKNESHFDRLMDIMDTYYNICHEIAAKGNRLDMETKIVIPNLGGNVTTLLHTADLETIFQHGLHFHEGLLNTERTNRGMKAVHFIQMPGKENKKGLPKIKNAGPPFKSLESVAVHGLFDHLDTVNNDKRILHGACFRAKRRLLVALAAPNDNEKFPELIQPVQERKARVEAFLNLIKPPNLRIEVIPYTRTGVPEKCALVEETHKVDGMVCEDFPEPLNLCRMVNEMRLRKDMQALDLFPAKAAKARFTSADYREWLSKNPNRKK